MKKAISLILILCMLCPLLLACDDVSVDGIVDLAANLQNKAVDTDGAYADTSAETEAESADDKEDKPSQQQKPSGTENNPSGIQKPDELTPELPKVDFNGIELVFAIGSDESSIRDFAADGDFSSHISKQAYQRTQKLESAANVKITYDMLNDGRNAISATVNSIMKYILAGETLHDVCVLPTYITSIIATDGCLCNIKDNEFECLMLDTLDWNESIIDASSAGDKAYMLVGDISASNYEKAIAMFYNTELAQMMGIDLVGQVKDGSWTMENMLAYSKWAYIDADGDNTSSENDIFGVTVSHLAFLEAFKSAFDTSFYRRNEEGNWQVELSSRMEYSLYDMADLFVSGSLFNSDSAKQIFGDGRSLFAVGTVSDFEYYSSSMNSNFGILPLPKYDSTQEKYATTAPTSDVIAFCFGHTVERIQASACVISILQILSEDNTLEWVKEKYFRYVSSADDFDMLEIIGENVVYEVDAVFESAIGTTLWLDVVKGNPLSSNFNMRKLSMQKQIDDLMKHLNV